MTVRGGNQGSGRSVVLDIARGPVQQMRFHPGGGTMHGGASYITLSTGAGLITIHDSSYIRYPNQRGRFINVDHWWVAQ